MSWWTASAPAARCLPASSPCTSGLQTTSGKTPGLAGREGLVTGAPWPLPGDTSLEQGPGGRWELCVGDREQAVQTKLLLMLCSDFRETLEEDRSSSHRWPLEGPGSPQRPALGLGPGSSLALEPVQPWVLAAGPGVGEAPCGGRSVRRTLPAATNSEVLGKSPAPGRSAPWTWRESERVSDTNQPPGTFWPPQTPGK